MHPCIQCIHPTLKGVSHMSVVMKKWNRQLGNWILAGSWHFFFTTKSKLTLGTTQPPIWWGPGAICLDKWSSCEADHWPSSAEAKKVWSYTSTPHTPSWYSDWWRKCITSTLLTRFKNWLQERGGKKNIFLYERIILNLVKTSTK
jgi:hypothetical protein